LAARENASDLVGGVKLDDKDDTLAAVLLDLAQSATMKASDDVANYVLSAMKRVGKTHKPDVERANFVVLRSPDVPSMLIETAFISNPGEERKLNDPAHRQRLAAAIVNGVKDYFNLQGLLQFAAPTGKLAGFECPAACQAAHRLARRDTQPHRQSAWHQPVGLALGQSPAWRCGQSRRPSADSGCLSPCVSLATHSMVASSKCTGLIMRVPSMWTTRACRFNCCQTP